MPVLKANWKDVALKAWSMYALYISILFQAADNLMPFFIDYSSPVWVKGVAFVITVLAAYFRLMPQRNLPTEESVGPQDQT